MTRRAAILWLALLSGSTAAHAAKRPPVPPPPEPTPAAPLLSEDGRWTAGLLIGVGCLFAAGALVGPFYRTTRPMDLPPTHSHDEPPGASRHHGRAGTYDHHPPERRH